MYKLLPIAFTFFIGTQVFAQDTDSFLQAFYSNFSNYCEALEFQSTNQGCDEHIRDARRNLPANAFLRSVVHQNEDQKRRFIERGEEIIDGIETTHKNGENYTVDDERQVLFAYSMCRTVSDFINETSNDCGLLDKRGDLDTGVNIWNRQAESGDTAIQ